MLLDLSHSSGYGKSVLEFELRNLFLEAEVGFSGGTIQAAARGLSHWALS